MGRDARADQVTTLADVAAAAGVSIATASKALADRYDVAQKTKERVLEVAEELAFSPNVLARGLLGGSTQSVGIIASEMDGRFAPAIMKGAEDALGADSSNVILTNSRNDPDLELRQAKALLGRRVDGLLVVGHTPEPRAPLRLRTGVPVVYVYAPCKDPDETSFVCDNVETARIATEAMLRSGRCNIAYVGGPATATAARDRADGVRRALDAAGLEFVGGGPLWGEWLEAWGWDTVARLLDGGERVDGLVCADDSIARGARDQLETRSLRVPEDVALVGFDNRDVVNSSSRNPFSSMDMSLVELGRIAARAVISGELTPGVTRFPGTLADRGTTG